MEKFFSLKIYISNKWDLRHSESLHNTFYLLVNVSLQCVYLYETNIVYLLSKILFSIHYYYYLIHQYFHIYNMITFIAILFPHYSISISSSSSNTASYVPTIALKRFRLPLKTQKTNNK